jgi:phosphate:Na+ symporter
VYLVSFNLTRYSLLLIFLGFALTSTKPKSIRQSEHAGAALFGLGLLFYAIRLMGTAMSPLREYPPFIEILATMDNRAAGIFAGAAATFAVQASAAVLGIVIVLAQQVGRIIPNSSRFFRLLANSVTAGVFGCVLWPWNA